MKIVSMFLLLLLWTGLPQILLFPRFIHSMWEKPIGKIYLTIWILSFAIVIYILFNSPEYWLECGKCRLELTRTILTLLLPNFVMAFWILQIWLSNINRKLRTYRYVSLFSWLIFIAYFAFITSGFYLSQI